MIGEWVWSLGMTCRCFVCVVPMVTVMGVEVDPVCPSSLNVSWFAVSPSALGGPGHASSYLITYSSPVRGVATTSVPYFHDTWVCRRESSITMATNITCVARCWCQISLQVQSTLWMCA